jgi:hypothetical protein
MESFTETRGKFAIVQIAYKIASLEDLPLLVASRQESC